MIRCCIWTLEFASRQEHKGTDCTQQAPDGICSNNKWHLSINTSADLPRHLEAGKTNMKKVQPVSSSDNPFQDQRCEDTLCFSQPLPPLPVLD